QPSGSARSSVCSTARSAAAWSPAACLAITSRMVALPVPHLGEALLVKSFSRRALLSRICSIRSCQRARTGQARAGSGCHAAERRYPFEGIEIRLYPPAFGGDLTVPPQLRSRPTLRRDESLMRRLALGQLAREAVREGHRRVTVKSAVPQLHRRADLAERER